MQTVDITAKDSEIEVIYGKHWSPYDTPRQEAYGHLKYLYSDISDIRKYYIRLGFHLNEFRNLRYYEDFNYLDFHEFCEVNLGMDKGAVSRCINVYKEFSISNDITNTVGGCGMDLSDRWKDYSYTQLCEMLPLSEKEREEITPEMTVKQIREYKKKLRDSEKSSRDYLEILDDLIQKGKADPVASTQPEKKLFDFDEYKKKKGIIRRNYVKSCDTIDIKCIHIFDCEGREILLDCRGEVLEYFNGQDGDIAIRMITKNDVDCKLKKYADMISEKK